MKRQTMKTVHLERLDQALDIAAEILESNRAVLADPDELYRKFIYGGLNYNENKSSSAELSSLKGKQTRKYAQLTVYRDERGLYEVNVYLL